MVLSKTKLQAKTTIKVVQMVIEVKLSKKGRRVRKSDRLGYQILKWLLEVKYEREIVMMCRYCLTVPLINLCVLVVRQSFLIEKFKVQICACGFFTVR